MKTTLHLAISADGFIAKTNGDSDWVDPIDETLFKQRAQDAGCLVVGRKTFEQYKDTIYPVAGAINIVVTSNQNYTAENVLIANSPENAIQMAESNDCAGILIAGGAHISAAFLEAGLIDEIFFSVHPLILGQGMKPFEGSNLEKRLKLVDSKKLSNDLIELHYQVLK